MATAIRLKRVGSKKAASYRIVVTDSREGTSGAPIERLGTYNPRTQPSMVKINAVRTLHWLNEGAQPSDTVKSLLRKTGVWKQFHDGVDPATIEEAVVEIGPPPGERGTSQRPAPIDREPKEYDQPEAEVAEEPAAEVKEAPEAEAETEPEEEAAEAEEAPEAPAEEATKADAEAAPEEEAAPESEVDEAPEAEAAQEAPEVEAEEPSTDEAADEPADDEPADEASEEVTAEAEDGAEDGPDSAGDDSDGEADDEKS